MARETARNCADAEEEGQGLESEAMGLGFGVLFLKVFLGFRIFFKGFGV